MERRSTTPGDAALVALPAGDVGPSVLLERDDVAFVPRIGLGVVSLATVFSLALRPGERDFDVAVMAWSGVLVVVAAASMMPPARRVIARFTGRAGRAGRAAGFTAIGVLMSLALGAISWPDGGISAPFFTAMVAVAAFIGLVLPARAAALTMLGPTAVITALQLHAAAERTLDTVAVPVMICTAWALGRAGHRLHARATRVALLRSRSDTLTATLNRRGFFEQFEHQLAVARREVRPLSVVSMDLDGFKAVNDASGHAAGDELLTWVGMRIADVLPDDATAGRIGGDEFAFLLPGGKLRAHRLAERLRHALAERIGASIGYATGTPADARDADELLRIADARMYAAKHGTTARLPEAPTAPSTHRDASRMPLREEAPRVAYADIRRRGSATGTAPDRPAGLRPIDLVVALTVAVAGVALVPLQLAQPGETAADRVLELAFVPWLLCNLIVIGLMYRLRETGNRGAGRLLYLASSMLLGSEICVALLAGPGDGIASPLIGALFLKLIVDGAASTPERSRENAIVIGGWWAVAAIAGPADALWLLPFQLSMMVASRAIGVVSRNAFTESARRITELAHADSLTGLANRAGWEAAIDDALQQAAAGKPLGLLAVDLDDFKAINDQLGHEAGDELLRSVAAVLREALPGAYVIARVGGDEFVAALPIGDHTGAAGAAARLGAALGAVVRGSIGWAIYGADGGSLDELAKVADRRSYAAKRAQRSAV